MKFNKWWSLPFCLAGLCVLALSVNQVCAQTSTATINIFPKYIVLGVVYAPPGSASNVIYGNSTQVGSTDSVSTGSTASTIYTNSTTVGGSLFGWGASQTNTSTDGWTTGFTNSGSIAIQTTSGNSISTMGPISSSLGVNHDNDVIYILLNPAVLNTVTFNTTTGVLSSSQGILWDGLLSNGCDLSDTSDSPTFYQQLSGCDSNQFPYPDIVGIPVWCLKNPYYPGQGCEQWLQYTSRSWDQSYRGPASTNSTGVAYPQNPNNPAELTLQDYADILQADPFVTLNGNAVNVCHPTYGPDVDPNDPETILASYPITPAGSQVNYARKPGSCGNTVISGVVEPFTMNRFQPYGTVEYPVPGPNGLPSTYAGMFQYSNTTQNISTTTDTHTSGTSTDTTYGDNQSFSAWGISVASFNLSYSSGSSNSVTWQNSNSAESSNTTSSYANYSITGPQLSDNYTGPATYNVYLDNVYGTYAFYSPLEPKPTLGTIAIAPGASPTTANVALAAFPTMPVGGSLSGSNLIPITLTNNSTYSLTMAGPAVTFSDPGFVLFEPANYPGLTNAQNYPDGCSNQQLLSYGQTSGGQTYYCTLYLLFTPQNFDEPNPVTLVNSPSLQATMIAAGTENVDPYQNILVTSQAAVSGTVQGSTQGATLLPTGVSQSTLTTANPLPYIFTFPVTTNSSETQSFTFKNNYTAYSYSPAITITQIAVSNPDYSIVSGSNCLGTSVASGGGTCTFTVQFNPPVNVTGMVDTTITVTGTVLGWYISQPFQLAIAGAVGPAKGGVSYSADLYFSGNYNETLSGEPGCGETGDGDTLPACGWTSGGNTSSITFTNTSQYTADLTITPVSGTTLSLYGSGCGSTLAANSSCTQEIQTSYCTPIVNQFSNTQCTTSFVDNSAVNVAATLVEGSTDVTQFNTTIPATADLTINNIIYVNFPSVVPITIHGVEQSNTTTVPATAATASLTVQQALASSVSVASSSSGPSPASGPSSASGPAPSNGTPKLTLAVKVGSFQTTVQTPAGSAAATVAQAVAKALTVLGSPVKATASGAVVTMTSYAKGSAANVAFTVTGNENFTVASSGSALAGGKNATTTTKYDAGLVNLATNGVTASAQWGEGSTPATVAQALAASVNKVASAYWTATASGDVVTLNGVSSSSASKGESPVTPATFVKSSVSKTADTASSSPVSLTVSDTAGFTPASFDAATN